MLNRRTKLLTILISLLALAPAGASAAPANDNFASAQVVGPGLPISVAASSVDATAEPGEAPHYPPNPVVRSIWFQWTANVSATVVIDTCERGNGLDSLSFNNLAVYTGASLGALTPVGSTAGNDCLFRFDSVNGSAYRIAVDFSGDDEEGEFQFKLRVLTPPANDNFASAQVVGPGLPISVPGTTVDSTWETNEPAALGGTSNSRSVWYRWKPAASGQVRLDTCETTRVSGAANRRTIVTKDGTLPLAGADTVISDTGCELTFAVNADTDYWIGFSGSFQGELDFMLKILSAPVPTNDVFANATEIGPALPIAIAGNNDFATLQTGETQHGGEFGTARSVWYRWTPTEASTVRVNACSPYYNGSRLGVYTGPTVDALTKAITPPGHAPYCHVDLNAVAGTTYRIAVAGQATDGGGGPFTLRLQQLVRPANDDFANALELSGLLPLSHRATNFAASKEAGEQGHYEYGAPLASVWFRWRAPAAGQFELRACDSEFSNAVALYTGTEPASLSPVEGEELRCADEGNGSGSGVRFQGGAGQEYLIAVDATRQGHEGDFTLRIDGPNALPIKISGPAPFSLKRALAQCRKLKNRAKRARCIRQAHLRAGRIKCGKVRAGAKRKRCLKASRRKAGIAFCRNAYVKRAKVSRCIAGLKAAKR